LLEQFATRLEPRFVVVGLAIALRCSVVGALRGRLFPLEGAGNRDAPRPSAAATIAVPLLALSAAIVSAVIVAVEWLK
jgi:hypothetical protein